MPTDGRQKDVSAGKKNCNSAVTKMANGRKKNPAKTTTGENRRRTYDESTAMAMSLATCRRHRPHRRSRHYEHDDDYPSHLPFSASSACVISAIEDVSESDEAYLISR